MTAQFSATPLPAKVNRNQIAKRRSPRMGLNAAIGVSGHDRQKCHFTMPARATNLNRHGAAIQLNRELSVGSTVVVKNKNGVQASARVVVHVSAVDGVRTYGIEFLEGNDHFWGITFPDGLVEHDVSKRWRERR
jgi:PilZ domain